jgi:hypothetical protein
MAYIKRPLENLRTLYSEEDLPNQFRKAMRIYKNSPDQINFSLLKETVLIPLHESMLKKINPPEIPRINNVLNIFGGHILSVKETSKSQANNNQEKSNH